MSFIGDDEYIYVKLNSLSNEMCDELIRLFEDDLSEFVRPGTIFGNKISDHKKTFDLTLSNKNNIFDQQMFEELTSNIKIYIDTITEKYDKIFFPTFNMTDNGFHVQKYNCGEGYYKYHQDFAHSDDKIQMRIITFIWYLNTVEEGGETEFFNGRIKIKPERGKLLLFPATWTYVHRGNMPISCDKYIVTGWIYNDI
jgi:hypothetical protein